MIFRRLLLVVILLAFSSAYAQEKAMVKGTVKSKDKKPLEAATVAIPGNTSGTHTDENGYFELEVTPNVQVTVVVTYIGYAQQSKIVIVPKGQTEEISFIMEPSLKTIRTFVVEDKATRSQSISRINPRTATLIPTTGQGVEAIIKTLPGVSSNNELSSQYMVRGGNFDENLVYVNDIEIYRPLLIRSGQQEGLSFINPDMVSSILFSAGGFEAKYGDKSASVLDIKYRKPTEFGGNASVSLLGASAHVEGVTQGYRLTYQLGIRQKSNQYLLGAMETQGEYRPSFTDVQTFLTYDVSDKFELNFLGNLSRNIFRVVPIDRQSTFGHINQAMRLSVYFDGQEVSSFNTGMGAVSGIWRPRQNLNLRLISSVFRTTEKEYFDIQGQYWLDELERDLGSDDFGEVRFNRGIGTYLNHARNRLDATVVNLQHRGDYAVDDRAISWGASAQREIIDDRLNEWTMIDSAFFSIPQYPAENIYLQDVVKSTISVNNYRYSGYFQYTFNFGKEHDYTFTAGSRANYRTLNNQLLFSPRFNFSLKPNWNKDFLFKISAGAYHQPPFYREMRDFQGNINPALRAQNSYHLIIGSDYNFTAWGRPFKFISEAYYKHFDNLVPYKVDNVRLRYYAKNNAYGYGTGIDFKVNGEFVKGIESWASLSFMNTMENLRDDFYYTYFNGAGERVNPTFAPQGSIADSVRVEPGFLPRPTDQRVVFGMFFQDYLPVLPSFKMHLNFLYGSRLPFGPPAAERHKDVLRMPPYRRVDIGFSYQIYDAEKRPREESFMRHFKDLWISAEVFNLLQIQNTISYLWVKDDQNVYYAVPNFLTPRLINVRLVGKF
jgi:hypothetical protein